MTDETCVGQCRTRYVVTTRQHGWVLLRYTPRELRACDKCCKTDSQEAREERE